MSEEYVRAGSSSYAATSRKPLISGTRRANGEGFSSKYIARNLILLRQAGRRQLRISDALWPP
jgi:hypothetical protein